MNPLTENPDAEIKGIEEAEKFVSNFKNYPRTLTSEEVMSQVVELSTKCNDFNFAEVLSLIAKRDFRLFDQLAQQFVSEDGFDKEIALLEAAKSPTIDDEEFEKILSEYGDRVSVDGLPPVTVVSAVVFLTADSYRPDVFRKWVSRNCSPPRQGPKITVISF